MSLMAVTGLEVTPHSDASQLVSDLESPADTLDSFKPSTLKEK